LKSIKLEICNALGEENLAFLGYSDTELVKIEKLYDVVVDGQFKVFLTEMGKSDGGVIGDYDILLYRSRLSLRSHILFQASFFTSMQEIGAYDYLHNKPFVFARLSETYYYFLQTSNRDDLVYLYDENEDTVSATGETLFEFLIKLAISYKGRPRILTQGNLIEI
jgi:hypothetical protein